MKTEETLPRDVPKKPKLIVTPLQGPFNLIYIAEIPSHAAGCLQP